ncbi:MAG: transcriptional repressor [Hyphomicrobiaceae bacterium]
MALQAKGQGRSQERFPEPGHDHGPCLAHCVARAEAAFEARGLSLTPLRRQVLLEIASTHAAIGAYEVLERLAGKHGRRLAPISVYRALDSLVDVGLVHRLESRNAFFACHRQHVSHDDQRAALVCKHCATVVEVPAGDVVAGLWKLAGKAGFLPGRIMIEVTGTCERCRGEAQ